MSLIRRHATGWACRDDSIFRARQVELTAQRERLASSAQRLKDHQALLKSKAAS